jgi:hypothetical protein
MRSSLSKPLMAIVAATLLAIPAMRTLAAPSQLRQQTTTFAIRFDPIQLLAERPLNTLPMWIQSVSVQHHRFDATVLNISKADATRLRHTSIRLHLRKLNFLAQTVELRVSLAPGIGQATAASWTETGTQIFHSEPFGSQEEAATETIFASIEGADYLEIDIPGDGSRLKGLFASAMRYTKVLQAVDFNTAPIADAFGNSASTLPSRAEDRYLWNRVDAPLDAGPFPVTAGQPQAIEFELASQPTCAVVSFEVRNVVPDMPPVLQLNEADLPPASLSLPDLADPAWHALGESAAQDGVSSTLHYTGWIRVQQFLPGSVLQKGKNLLQLAQPIEGESIEIRRVELQLRSRR